MTDDNQTARKVTENINRRQKTLKKKKLCRAKGKVNISKHLDRPWKHYCT